MYVQRNIEARSRKHYCCGKDVNVKYFSVCVCGGGGWCTYPGSCLCLCSFTYIARNAHTPYFLQPLSPLNFSTLSHTRHDYWKKNLLKTKWLF
jgi:hypothetical protein